MWNARGAWRFQLGSMGRLGHAPVLNGILFNHHMEDKSLHWLPPGNTLACLNLWIEHRPIRGRSLIIGVGSDMVKPSASPCFDAACHQWLSR